MRCQSLFSLLPAAAAFKLLVPLYIYPEPDAWTPLLSAVSAHPTTTFQVIINPNSGPGPSAFPDDTYAAAIAQLRAHANVELVGYVHVSWGARAEAEILAEIDIYSGWAGYPSGEIAMSGIFFDEAPNAADEDMLAYMQTVSLYAQQAISSSSPKSNSTSCFSSPASSSSRSSSPSSATTIFNMGTAPQSTKYFDFASQIVVMEWAYADYSAGALAKAVPEGYAAQSSVILHDFSGDADALEEFFSDAWGMGLDAASATADCCYNSLDPVGGAGGIGAVENAFAKAAA